MYDIGDQQPSCSPFPTRPVSIFLPSKLHCVLSCSIVQCPAPATGIPPSNQYVARWYWSAGPAAGSAPALVRQTVELRRDDENVRREISTPGMGRGQEGVHGVVTVGYVAPSAGGQDARHPVQPRAPASNPTELAFVRASSRFSSRGQREIENPADRYHRLGSRERLLSRIGIRVSVGAQAVPDAGKLRESQC